MGNLMFAMMKKYGTVEVDVIGNRGGENMHETMDGKVFSNQVEQFTIEEIMEMI
jgi:FlaA1/EpsC-like NDP-sugar epimerase